MEINGKEGGKREYSVGTREIIKGGEGEKGGRENGQNPTVAKKGGYQGDIPGARQSVSQWYLIEQY